MAEPALGTTYEIMQPPPENGVLKRLERWKLQATARSILPSERVALCLRRVIPNRITVGVWKSEKHRSAHYDGLMVCGSVWHCPVCASKVSERKRVDLVQGIEAWKALGGVVLMLTQTVPHYAHQPLEVVLSGFTRARRLMRNRKPWKGFAKRICLKGSVRALEVTYGENGWHVHAHELLFIEPGFSEDLCGIEGEVLQMWQSACISAGLDCPNVRGIRVHNGDQAGDYAGKWGLEHEVTKANIKRGRDGNYSPWDLLRRADGGDQAASALFGEYAGCFKGKRQLVWSDGLRDLLGLGLEKTDEELAKTREEDAVLLGALTRSQWGIITAAERRGEILEIALSKGWPGVLDYIDKLVHKKT